ncbi:fumarate hydratase FumD [Escherichia coli]|nr:fumarate hydratase FumD [Escherichia coli]
MGNQTKDDELYREMCRVVGKVVLEMRDLGQEPKHIVIAGVLRTTLANQRVKRSELPGLEARGQHGSQKY